MLPHSNILAHYNPRVGVLTMVDFPKSIGGLDISCSDPLGYSCNGLDPDEVFSCKDHATPIRINGNFNCHCEPGYKLDRLTKECILCREDWNCKSQPDFDNEYILEPLKLGQSETWNSILYMDQRHNEFGEKLVILSTRSLIFHEFNSETMDNTSASAKNQFFDLENSNSGDNQPSLIPLGKNPSLIFRFRILSTYDSIFDNPVKRTLKLGDFTDIYQISKILSSQHSSRLILLTKTELSDPLGFKLVRTNYDKDVKDPPVTIDLETQYKDAAWNTALAKIILISKTATDKRYIYNVNNHEEEPLILNIPEHLRLTEGQENLIGINETRDPMKIDDPLNHTFYVISDTIGKIRAYKIDGGTDELHFRTLNPRVFDLNNPVEQILCPS